MNTAALDDPLEPTQEIMDMPYGVYRVIAPRQVYPVLEFAPGLSVRYPSIYVRLTVRQAD